MNRIDRLLGYLLLFQSRSLLRAQDIAQRFEISERTVYRDIDALCEVGVPIVGMPGEGYRLMAGYHLPPIMFSQDEARALYFAVAMLTGATTTGATQSAATTALDKIRAVLPRATRAQVEAMEAVLGFHSVARPRLDLDDTLFLRLQEAIHASRVVHLRYHAQHTNQVTERDVEPLQLVYVDRIWLLSAYCRLRQDQRNFRLARIDGLRVLDETFAPRELHIHDYPSGEHLVVVRFSPETVRWVREQQHFSFVQERSPAPEDGGAVMCYRVSELQRIKQWLLSWGAGMEVLEPPELRAEMAKDAVQLLEKHRRAQSE